jgi:iron complex outermembrane receptor protein
MKRSRSTGVVSRATIVCTLALTLTALVIPTRQVLGDQDVPPPAQTTPTAASQPPTSPPVKAPPPVVTTPAVQPAPQPAAQVAAAGPETKKLAPVIVTGSLIPTAETVGASPVDTITAADISTVAAPSVLDLVKKLDASFSGARNVGFTLNNGGFGESYVAIRNLPSLVLINGHRLGNSSFSNGGLVDLNTIPQAAIERIEILKDGSSALYGSEAVGGVVNIITKKDYSGVETFGRFGGATGEGNYFEETSSIVGGITTEKAHFLAAAQYYNSDPLSSWDRTIASQGYNQLAKHGIQPAYVPYFSPSFPGKVQDGSGTWYLDQTHYQTPPTAAQIPALVGQQFTTVSDYNAAVVGAGFSAPYGTTPSSFTSHGLLNTTQFGSISVQSQNRKQFFGEGDYDIVGKELQVFGEFLYANLHSQGALAPSPVIGLGRFQSNIDIPAGNIYNPFGIDLGPDYANGLPPAAPRIRSRFWDSGNREFDSSTDYYHFVGGLKGTFENGYTYNGSYTYNNYDQEQKTLNAINGSALGAALTPNINPSLAAQGVSQLQGANGVYVPQYNLFGYPGQNSKDTLKAISCTLYNSGHSEEWSADGNITGSLFDLPGGKQQFAIGGGFGSDSLSIDFDGLTKEGKVPGLNATEPTSGTQTRYDLYVEMRTPLTSPDNDIPLLHRVELTSATRFDSYSPGGDQIVPKFGLRWQPIDEQVTLRAQYSKSFIAPTPYQLFGGSAQSNPTVTTASGTAQETVLFTQNPNLTAQNSEQFGFGAVVSPKAIKGLTVSVDYYHIRMWDVIYRLDPNTMVADLNANGSNSKYQPYYRFSDGSQITTPAPNQVVDATWGSLETPLENGAHIETDGLDLSANYELPWQQYGKLTLYANANYLFDFKYSDPTIGGPYQYAGQYTDVEVVGGGQGLLPTYTVNSGFTYELWDFTYTFNTRYVPQTTDKGDGFPNNDSNSYTELKNKAYRTWTIGAYFQVDMQLAYEIGKTKPNKAWYDNTTIAVGCNNVGDAQPKLISSSSEDNTDKSSYDIIGRFVYFQVSKKF